MDSERHIERSFPIVQLNPLSVRERNAFKPVYKMHKWFARRSSSIFRAILLGAALPAEQDGKPVDLMEEFYRGHGDDQRLRRADGTPLRVLDPFMGGGTTVPDVICPICKAKFDWELDRCTVTAGGPQVSGEKGAGKGRPANAKCAFAAPGNSVVCPHCANSVEPSVAASGKVKSKKVQLHVLVDPSTGDFFEVRGVIPETVTAPKSGHTFFPGDGPVAGGKFTCQACGRKQDIVESARVHGKPLPFRYYGFYAYTAAAEKDADASAELGLPTNNYKWFAPVQKADLARMEEARVQLEECGQSLPLPNQEIYDGYNTNRLVIHQYKRWSDLYGPRQLLALGKLLKAISEEPEPTLRDALLGAFQSHVDNASFLTGYHFVRNMVRNVTAAHDYRNPTTIVENNIWGVPATGQGTFSSCLDKVVSGLTYPTKPDLPTPDRYVSVDDVPPERWKASLLHGSATELAGIPTSSTDLVVSDPPYAGSVQYAEMSDWSYVWLQKVLASAYPKQFGSEITLKAQEIIEDGGIKDAGFFFEQLTDAWRECHRVLVDDGLLVFTFHHREGDRWTGLLRSLFDAGFYLVAAYPTHSEALNSIVIQATKGITYDIIHVCRKRLTDPEPIPWSKLRRQVTREARDQLREIEQGKDVLPGPDIQMILLGKALKLFSQHYGKVLNAEGGSLSLDEAMQRILVLVREVRGEDLPLPSALLDVDSLSQVALLHVVGKGPWARDDLHKELRGYGQSLSSLEAAGLVRPVENKKGRLEAVPAVDRGRAGVSSTRHGPLIDKLHLLLAYVSDGRSIESLMKLWRGRWEVIAEGLQWLGKVDPGSKELVGLTHRQVEALGTDPGPQAMTEQLGLFGGADG